MPVALKLPDGTRVKDKDGREGKTIAFLPQKGATGGYTVQWDSDASQSDMYVHQLDPASGTVVSAADYESALTRVTTSLGGYAAKAEGKWLHQGKAVESVLIVSKPRHLTDGQEMHAHASTGGGLRKVHVKFGNTYVRDVFKDGKFTSEATIDDQAWVANIKLRNTLVNSKAAYLSGKKALPT